MLGKIEVTIDVIIHATEDISKIFESFEKVLGIEEKVFTIRETGGHFDNPIIMLNAKIVKKEALKFMKKFLELLSDEQINRLTREIDERTVDSRLYMRLDKQELIKENLVLGGENVIKMKIHTPIYNKKDTVRIFTEVFQIAN